jgi:hypothetical protein
MHPTFKTVWPYTLWWIYDFLIDVAEDYGTDEDYEDSLFIREIAARRGLKEILAAYYQHYG